MGMLKCRREWPLKKGKQVAAVTFNVFFTLYQQIELRNNLSLVYM